MSAHTVTHPSGAAAADRGTGILQRDAGYQAFLMLRLTFVVAPLVAGIDKFFNGLVHWEKYLASWVNDILPGTATTGMHIVGVVEIVAGLVVAVKPKFGAPLVAAWLLGIIVNLLSYSGYYDVALRDFGLMLGALTLTRLAWAYSK